MSRSSRHTEKQGSHSELSRDSCNEGTAARTRPFSFDEVMLRRRNKKQSGDVGTVISVKDVAEKVSDHSEAGRSYRNKRDLLSVIVKHSSDDLMNVSSGKKEDGTSMSEEKMVRRKDKQTRDSETKARVMLNKDFVVKTKGSKDDKPGRWRRDNNGGLSSDSENGSGKRHPREYLAGKDRYADRNRVKSEKDTKRKHRSEEDEKSREKNVAKKYDSGKRHDSEILGRKERKELSEFYNKELRSRKRRSRSREHDKDRRRRSPSLSPRTHKHASYNLREHGEMSSHSSKDRSRRHEPDDDRNKTSGNGSSGQYRRHVGSISGLGGYSPRKRRSEAAARTPSPPPRSPEKRNAGWDLPPLGAEISPTGSVLPNVQPSNQAALSNTFELSSVASVSSVPIGTMSGLYPNAAIDSIQLTQSTRPMRRLYVENLPASASEKTVMECLNNFLLASGVNHIKGTQPCISCIIHKEKGQALVEFLTPEDASAALSFDGRSFSGSILKIRRPKDYVEVTGVPDKIVAAFDSTSDIVRDSPYKIFVGGISNAITSEMLREIASAFGPLKAFHFEVNMEPNGSCAFLEYVDQSVTRKACAGLNGMRLGGQLLTVVLATPNLSSFESGGNSPFYDIPKHAKPLLEKPTEVLKLKNVLDPEGLSSLSELELEEILEDIRIECARFGSVVSVNVVKNTDLRTILKKCNVFNDTASIGQGLNCEENMRTEISSECTNCEAQETSSPEPSSNDRESKEVEKVVDGDGIGGEKLTADLIEDKMCEPGSLDSTMTLQDTTHGDNSNAVSLDTNDQLNLKDQMDCHHGDEADDILQSNGQMEDESEVQQNLESEETNGKPLEALAESQDIVKVDVGAPEKSENRELVLDLENVFEPGCILVEYRRAEASSVAAICLHGRLFDERIVTVEYVAYDFYKARFPK